MNAKLVKNVTTIFHCMFRIIATAGDRLKVFDLCDSEVSIILFFQICDYFSLGFSRPEMLHFLLEIWIIICFQIGMECHESVCKIRLELTVALCEGILRTNQGTT